MQMYQAQEEPVVRDFAPCFLGSYAFILRELVCQIRYDIFSDLFTGLKKNKGRKGKENQKQLAGGKKSN